MDIRAMQPLPSTPLLDAIPTAPSSGDPSTALRVKPQPTDAERAKFKKAATEFESFFLYYMMKTMRQAVPKGGLTDSKVGDTYLGLFDQEVAKQAAKQGGLGLAKTLESQMFPPPPGHLSFPAVPPIKSTEKEGS
ncbi:MAG TPA: rod-binding protein [Nitrospirales bacterium]|jgi:flagellar protein FlgJ